MEISKFLISYGTKAEWLKIKPLVSIDPDFFHIVKVNQHTNIFDNEDHIFNEEILIEESGENRLNNIVTSVLKYDISKFQKCLVQGDTCSAFSVCLNAFHQKLKIYHLEAGLRSFSKEPYPEESYRRAISAMADVHFCPNRINQINLEKERILNSYITGNTSLDNLDSTGSHYGNEIIVSIHRTENLSNIYKILETLDNLKINSKFVYISHPNFKTDKKYRNIKIFDNYLNHTEFVNLMKKCKFIITDSGGLIEEASFLKKKVIQIRKKSERNESKEIVVNSSVGSLREDVLSVDSNFFVPKDYKCPYGDGQSAKRIFKILKDVSI